MDQRNVTHRYGDKYYVGNWLNDNYTCIVKKPNLQQLHNALRRMGVTLPTESRQLFRPDGVGTYHPTTRQTHEWDDMVFGWGSYDDEE